MELPDCPLCRASDMTARVLPGTRLGPVRRDLLLRASDKRFAEYGGYPVHTLDASKKKSHDRAIRDLKKLGLIVEPQRVRVADQPQLAAAGRKWTQFRFIQLTPMGIEIVRLYRRELEGGKRIRWDERVQQALDAAIATCPHS